MTVLLYGCPTKCLGEKIDGNYCRMLHAILHKSCKKSPTKNNFTASYLTNDPSKTRKIFLALLGKQRRTHN